MRGGSYSTAGIYDNLTYTDGWHNWSMTDGFWMNPQSFTEAWLYGTVICDGNTFLADEGQSAYGTNTSARGPAAARTSSSSRMPTRRGAGNIIVFNWDLDATVSVDVSSVLTNGMNYEVLHSMDPFGTAVATGTYNGSNITIPMTNLPIATPINYAAPAGSFPEFAAFVIRTQTGT